MGKVWDCPGRSLESPNLRLEMCNIEIDHAIARDRTDERRIILYVNLIIFMIGSQEAFEDSAGDNY